MQALSLNHVSFCFKLVLILCPLRSSEQPRVHFQFFFWLILNMEWISGLGDAELASCLSGKEGEILCLSHKSFASLNVWCKHVMMIYNKGIRFIVLYPPKCSHDLPPLAGTVHTETISIPRGIFQSNWQHIAHTL